MGNPIKGETPLNLADGRELTLVLDFEALVEAETVYGKPLQRLMQDAAVGYVGALRAMLYGALRAKHPDISLRDASALFMSDADAVSAALEQAGTAAFPDAKARTEGKKGGNPPGKTSGRSGAKQV